MSYLNDEIATGGPARFCAFGPNGAHPSIKILIKAQVLETRTGGCVSSEHALSFSHTWLKVTFHYWVHRLHICALRASCRITDHTTGISSFSKKKKCIKTWIPNRVGGLSSMINVSVTQRQVEIDSRPGLYPKNATRSNWSRVCLQP